MTENIKITELKVSDLTGLVTKQEAIIKELVTELEFWRYTSEGATEQEDCDRCDELLKNLKAP